MLSNGHRDAYDYPLARVWEEAELVVERVNGQLVNMAVVIQKATATTGMTASKESVKEFNDFVKKMIGD